MENIAQAIKEKAIALGYEKCGIIRISAVADYSDRLKERMSRIFLGRLQYGQFMAFAHPKKLYPWAKSIVVLVHSYAGYNIPGEFKGVYGSAYMFDDRLDENCNGFEMRKHFGEFLESMGLMTATDAKFGLTGLRWAAHKAGLGIIRRNNFFYTENGSWNHIEAWLIDGEQELIEKPALKECPDNCDKCIKSCPTGSLNRPYTMSCLKCISYITSLSAEKGLGMPSMKTSSKVGRWLYGCDACQDACPFNEGKWRRGCDFPGLDKLTGYMRPEKIMAMSYDEIAKNLAPKYWYIGANNLWKWKIDALTVMMNDFQEDYVSAIKSGMTDTNWRVRRFTKKVCKKLKI